MRTERGTGLTEGRCPSAIRCRTVRGGQAEHASNICDRQELDERLRFSYLWHESSQAACTVGRKMKTSRDEKIAPPVVTIVTTPLSLRDFKMPVELRAKPGRFLPMRFSIDVDDPRYPRTLLEVSSLPAPRITAVSARVRKEGWGPVVNEDVSRPATPGVVRTLEDDEMTWPAIDPTIRLPLARWLRLGVALAAAPKTHFKRTKFTAGHDHARQQIYDDLSRKRGAKPLDADFYASVADAAKRDPRRPVKAVLESGITTRGGQPCRRTVQNWLRKAEQLGLLETVH